MLSPTEIKSITTPLAFSFHILIAIYLIVGLDDIFIDLISFIRRLRPKHLSTQAMAAMATMPEKNIAIIIPAWDEGDIIKRMLVGNIARLHYSNYHIFVGCYPNDPATVNAVESLALEQRHVHAIVNYKDGPTSKGQILNWVIEQVLEYEFKSGHKFDAFLMQDSEDLIHCKTLQLVNRELETVDFVQIPVFSLALNPLEIVAGVYVDEFAECHTKDILVRDALGGAVPSAGVGTAMSRSFVIEHRTKNRGQVLRDGCLTEDYELGVLAGIAGWSQRFSACWYHDPVTGQREFIATREYFPKAFTRSIRQKVRWTIGIGLQGWRYVGWRGTLAQRYFLWRDRKGLVTNPILILGYVWALAFGLAVASPQISVQDIIHSNTLKGASLVTLLFAMNRVVQRFICVVRVYGRNGAYMIPARWPVGNIINAVAVAKAIWIDAKSRLTRQAVLWSKTQHELPSDFGIINGTESSPVSIVDVNNR